MNQLRRIFDLFIFGNVFIGLCSVALVFNTFLINGFPIQLTSSVVLVFSSTWFYYNFHHHSHHLDFTSFVGFKISLRARHFNTLDYLMLFIPACGIIFSIVFVQLPVLIAFLLISFFSILYSIPLVMWNGRRRRLRESLFLKLPFLALSWAAVTVLIPLLEQEQAVDTGKILGQAFARALFIYGLCIPFEIRDHDSEKKWGTNTLPVVYGIKITKIVGILMLVLGIALRHLIPDPMRLSTDIIRALDLSFIVAMIWILSAKSNPSKYFCKFYVDGTMILQFIFVYLAILRA